MVLNAGNTVLTDQSSITFQHNSVQAGMLVSNLNATGTGYSIRLENSDNTAVFWDAQETLGVESLKVFVPTTFDSDVTLDDSLVGALTLSVDNKIDLTHEFTYPGQVGYRIIGTSNAVSTGPNQLIFTPIPSQTNDSEIRLRTWNNTLGDYYETYQDNIGDLYTEGFFNIRSKAGLSSSSSGIEIRNFDWSDTTNGYWIQYASGAPSGVSSRLVFYPSDKDGTGFTGEFQLTVGNPSGTTYTWLFDKNGNLSRNGTNMTFP